MAAEEQTISITHESGRFRTLHEIQGEAIKAILRLYGPSEAARILRIGRKTLYRKIEAFQIKL